LLAFALGLILAASPDTGASEGLWLENGVAICTATNDQSDPILASDGNGGAIVIWYDMRGGNSDIYAQRINSNGVALWNLNGVAICTEIHDQFSPQVTADGQGGAIIAWYDTRSDTGDIYAQRVNSAGVPLWTTNGVAVCTAPNRQSDPMLVSDGNGGAIIAWFDNRGTNPLVYTQRINASGTPVWLHDGVPICATTANQYAPQLVADGQGGAIVAWYDGRSDAGDIYVQRIDQAGTLKWDAAGVAICTAANDQSDPQLVSDGRNGAIIAWYDHRAVNPQIYAQHVDQDGMPKWVANGVAVCASGYNQYSPQLITDGNGGAIVAWYDARNDAADIYAQHLDDQGALKWAVDGVATCRAANNQSDPMLAPDGKGGAVLAWYDDRTGNPDIYAQWLNSEGTAGWTDGGAGICTNPLGQYSPKLVTDGQGGAIVAWYDARNGGNTDIYAQRIVKLRPHALTINSPAAQGTNFHATITGSCFQDGQGSVFAAKLTRTASEYIVATQLCVVNSCTLTCDFNLTSAGLGDWYLVLYDNYWQSSPETLLLSILQPTVTSTISPTFTPTQTPTISPTITPTFTPTPTPTVSGTPTATPTTTETVLITTTGSPTSTESPTASATPTPTPSSTEFFTPTYVIVNTYTYIIDQQTNVVKIYDPSHQLLAVLPIQYQTWSMYINGNYAYLVNGLGILKVVDISDINAPRDIGEYLTGGDAAGISGYKDYVLVADGKGGVAVYDASLPGDMRMVNRVTSIGGVSHVNAHSISVNVNAQKAYVTLPDGKTILTMDLSDIVPNALFPAGGYATPNPFLPLRGQKVFFNIRFDSPAAIFTIRIYNLRGHLQRTLRNMREWDGRSEAGHVCEGGVYIYQIQADDRRVSGKVVLIK
jgi:hypothetical protein